MRAHEWMNERRFGRHISTYTESRQTWILFYIFFAFLFECDCSLRLETRVARSVPWDARLGYIEVTQWQCQPAHKLHNLLPREWSIHFHALPMVANAMGLLLGKASDSRHVFGVVNGVTIWKRIKSNDRLHGYPCSGHLHREWKRALPLLLN